MEIKPSVWTCGAGAKQSNKRQAGLTCVSFHHTCNRQLRNSVGFSLMWSTASLTAGMTPRPTRPSGMLPDTRPPNGKNPAMQTSCRLFGVGRWPRAAATHHAISSNHDLIVNPETEQQTHRQYKTETDTNAIDQQLLKGVTDIMKRTCKSITDLCRHAQTYRRLYTRDEFRSQVRLELGVRATARKSFFAFSGLYNINFVGNFVLRLQVPLQPTRVSHCCKYYSI